MCIHITLLNETLVLQRFLLSTLKRDTRFVVRKHPEEGPLALSTSSKGQSLWSLVPLTQWDKYGSTTNTTCTVRVKQVLLAPCSWNRTGEPRTLQDWPVVSNVSPGTVGGRGEHWLLTLLGVLMHGSHPSLI